MMIDFYPTKAQYRSNEPIALMFEHGGTYLNSIAVLSVYHLNSKVHCQYISIDSDPLLIPLPILHGAAFGAELTIGQSRFSTAFDVTETPGFPVRYGFLSDFAACDSGADDVMQMAKYHINTVQFYDWSFRHDQLVSDQDEYSDMMGRKVSLPVVKEKIEACHNQGMQALGYGAIYAASKPFYEKHRDWGLYTSAGDPHIFINTFCIMNIASSCPWRKRIIGQYERAVLEIGFDGIHMDTYGYPKTAFDSQGNSIRLSHEFASLIEETRETLKEARLIFNNVGNWPVRPVANAPQDAIYIEVWDPYSRYSHIRQIILDARLSCNNSKTVVLAAYLAPFRTGDPDQALNSARLLLAATASNGATNLLIGERDAVLTQGYYVDHILLKEQQVFVLRQYFDFSVRYEELFFDPSLEDISFTHIGGDNQEYRYSGPAWSPDGQADTIWLTLRENESRKVISIINLLGNDDSWNAGKKQPVSGGALRFAVQVDHKPCSVWMASPDNGGHPLELPFDFEITDRGHTAAFAVDAPEFWGLVFLELG